MPLTKKGSKIMKAMKGTYGSDAKAKQVFYASKNAGKISGVEGREEEKHEALEGFVKKLRKRAK